jgi:hypothetical protein
MLEGHTPADLRAFDRPAWQAAAEHVVDGVLMAQRQAESDEAPLRESILDALENEAFRAVLVEASRALDGGLDDEWLPWLQGRFAQTVAAAWQAAAQHLCPEFNLDNDVAVDVLLDRPDGVAFALSDAAPGGGALIESLVRRISEDPRRFDALVVTALEPGDAELVDVALRRAVALLADDRDVQKAAQQFRECHSDRLQEWLDLADVLADRGVDRSHAVLAALAARVFRPGSGPSSDALLSELLARWDEAEERAGFAIDHRAISAFLARDEAVMYRLNEFAGGSSGSESPTRTQSVLMGLLWTRGCAARPQALRATNRFLFETRATERTLVKAVLPAEPPQVDVDDANWRAALAHILRVNGRALLCSGSGDVARLSTAARNLVVDPVDLDWLRVFPQVHSMVREIDGTVSVRVVVREAPQ